MNEHENLKNQSKKKLQNSEINFVFDYCIKVNFRVL
jgi:hypothetical protein